MAEDLNVVTEDLVTFVQRLTNPNPKVATPGDAMPGACGMGESSFLWAAGTKLIADGVGCLTKVDEGFTGYKNKVMECHDDILATNGRNTEAILSLLKGEGA